MSVETKRAIIFLISCLIFGYMIGNYIEKVAPEKVENLKFFKRS